MCTLIITIGAGRFGTKHYKVRTTPRPNRREIKITQLRKELKSLKQQFRKTREEERLALMELKNITRQKLISLQHAE